MKRSRATRTANVECATPRLWRWFVANVRGAVRAPDGSFAVSDERAFAESLRAADGREIP